MQDTMDELKEQREAYGGHQGGQGITLLILHVNPQKVLNIVY